MYSQLDSLNATGRITLRAALAACALFGAAVSQAEAKFDWDEGLIVGADPWRATIGMQLNVDTGEVQDLPTAGARQSLLRRARPSLSVAFGDHWSTRVDYEFGDISPGIKNAWVQWKPSEGIALRLGSQTASFGLDAATGSQDYPFLERPIASALAPGLLVGAELTLSRPHGSLSLGYFGDNVNDDDRRSLQGRSIVLRAAGNPLRGKRGLWHVGISGEYRTAADAAQFRLNPRPETFLDSPRLIDTGRLAAVDRLVNIGVESALQHGPAILQGEYLHGYLVRSATSAPSVDMNGWYASFGWMLTGERRGYSRGNGGFRGVKPRHAWGAFEVVARVGELDLSDADVDGGTQRSATLGLNWYYRERMRVMLSYSRIEATTPGQPVLNPRVLAARAQLSF